METLNELFKITRFLDRLARFSFFAVAPACSPILSSHYLLHFSVNHIPKIQAYSFKFSSNLLYKGLSEASVDIEGL